MTMPDEHSPDGETDGHLSTFWKWTFVALGVLLFPMFLLAAVWAFTWNGALSLPDVGEPFDVNEVRRTSVPSAENAYTFYRQAKSELVNSTAITHSDPKRQKAIWDNFEETLTKGWPAANQDLRDWLDANRRTLEIWKRGTDCKDAQEFSARDVSIETLMSTTQDLREYARLALLEAARVEAQERPADAWIWYRAVLRSSRHVGMHSVIIGRLVGTAIEAMATNPLLRWSSRRQLTAADLRKALGDAEGVDAMTPPLSECFKIEYLSAFNSIDAMAAEKGAGLQTALHMTGYGEGVRRSLNAVFANWLSQVDRPRAHRKIVNYRRLQLFDIEPSSSAANSQLLPPDEIFKLGGFETNYRPDAILVGMLSPAIEGALNAADHEHVYRRAIQLGLALEVYRREHNEFPTTLEELVKAGLIKSVPLDPFDKGDPFHYRKESDPKQGALLWSVWDDGIDQDGRTEVDPERNHGPGDKVFRLGTP